MGLKAKEKHIIIIIRMHLGEFIYNLFEFECVWKSLSITYLILSSHITTFDKNCKCLKL